MKVLLTLSAFLGAVAVILGAFAAHGLKAKLMPEQLDSFQIGVKYQFYHVLAIMLVVLLGKSFNISTEIIGYLFVIGIFLFSGSIYLLACKDLLQISSWSKFLGPITPLGGLTFIIGWILLGIKLVQANIQT
jgi:uncharacterized membrane protein YgdD (TMEM256/DUF423 family)